MSLLSDATSTSRPWRGLDSNFCPCPDDFDHRMLADATESPEEEEPLILWEVVFTCIVLLFMLVALLSDRMGADSVMLTALTLFMASTIISIPEGVAGFANEGLLTVVVLFVVAHGISVTGALDWYMGKLLGRPKTVAGAQLRLMVPIACISAFLNNTPVVAVLIPIVQKWSKNIGVSVQQLMIPLSFASILGGTCTLIGTSTNLVVVGLLENRYPNDDSVTIGLFDLGEFGVPILLIGISYIMLVSPCLLPGGKSSGGDILSDDEVLLGARLTQWSPAAGRSVKRSGLRDTGGIFLVSVHRAATGNVHRAVGQEFVLNAGDTLFFTGLVDGFGEFCEEHGLEVVTTETVIQPTATETPVEVEAPTLTEDDLQRQSDHGVTHENLATVTEGQAFTPPKITIPIEIGNTAASLIQSDETERMRIINQLQDQIRGSPRDPTTPSKSGLPGRLPSSASLMRNASTGVLAAEPAQIVVTTDSHDSSRLVLVGVNARDRPGLLLDISKGLLRLNLQLRHTEASVIAERSLSIWRCECIESDLPDLEEVWSVMKALLELEGGIEALKKRGLRVIRAVVTKWSGLVGKTALEVDFRQTYKAAIVSVQQGGKHASPASTKFEAGDVLILQASQKSPLLMEPPEGFYERVAAENKAPSRNSSGINLKNLLPRLNVPDLKVFSRGSDENVASRKSTLSGKDDSGGDFFVGDIDNEDISSNVDIDQDVEGLEVSEMGDASVIFNTEQFEAAWRDLQVLSSTDPNQSTEVGANQREFLTAMLVAPDSALALKTAAQSGLTKLPGLFLVSIERPTANVAAQDGKIQHMVFSSLGDQSSSVVGSIVGSMGDSTVARDIEQKFVTMSPDEPLQVGDVLWFSGSASSVGDLRKIPGLKSFDSDQVEKINERVFDRRLVQAVVARKGPLVGKTVREVRFRTRYGAAVISVHREGQRVHDHPGQIKLHAGDVLLLEAGPSFIQKNAENDRSFALLSEVEDSAPPRLQKLIPALVLTVAMLAVYTAGVASLLTCSLCASILMVATGIMSEQEARDAVDWTVYITIACAFGIGTALVNSGVAGAFADVLVRVGESLGIGDAGLYGAVYLATVIISNIVTNNAAAALMFPIALDAAEQTGADVKLMSYILMLAASASFMSPFGYTTNLMIYGPGGYKFKDFLKIGTPMQVVLWIISIVIVSNTVIPWWVSWLICFGIFIVVASVLLTSGRIGQQMTQGLKSQLNRATGTAENEEAVQE